MCPKIVRCHCGAAAVIPIEIYGQETRHWCGRCGQDVVVPEGAIINVPRLAARKARVPLEPTPLETWMVSEAATNQAIDLINLREELLQENQE